MCQSLGWAQVARFTINEGNDRHPHCVMEELWQLVGFLAALAFVLCNVALAWVIAYWNILHKLLLLRKILHSVFNWQMKDSVAENTPANAARAAERQRLPEGVPRQHAD